MGPRLPLLAAAVAMPLFLSPARSIAEDAGLLVGKSAMGDWRSDHPGVRRRITVADLPPPYATRWASNAPRIVPRPPSDSPQVPPGFHVEQLAVQLENPRSVRVAPNGDIFIAETEPGRIRVLRLSEGVTKSEQAAVFASGLNGPFGMAFYPSGSDPQWLYVADTDAVLRFAYRSGDLKARNEPETIVAALPSGGHSTRDIGFLPDGKRMLVSVGSASNDAERIPRRTSAEIRNWEAQRGLGAAWGSETNRAAILGFDLDGRNGRIFASGIRNCVGLAIEPSIGEPWCSTNERDDLGDDLVPDYITRVREGAFYGWPWYYLGANQDPRHRRERADLERRVTVPDILVQSHSASMQMTFYDGVQFPPEYRGTIFAAEHGSWNRSKRTGYKIIRAVVAHGVPTGEYVDFMTGFVIDDRSVWGRPVGVAVTRDGSLLVTEDGNDTIWRVRYHGKVD